MFDTCTHKCGYCWLAEAGKVLDTSQLERFHDPQFVDRIVHFFNCRTDGENRWLLQFTGGEPLMTPNLDRLCNGLFEAGNAVAYYTGMFLNKNHPNFRYLAGCSPDDVNYIMASFHPESEKDTGGFFERMQILKDAGHHLFLRFVGQPGRLQLLDALSERCERMGICFYPTTLMSDRYPGAYTPEEKQQLVRHFSSLSQRIQIEGGVDTTKTRCYAGSNIIAVNLQSGNVTPCITVGSPVLGNLFENRLALYAEHIGCPSAGINCICDVHFQQDIIVGAEDYSHFEVQRGGFTSPRDFEPAMTRLRDSGFSFYVHPKSGMGAVADDLKQFYKADEIRPAANAARSN
jgi:hypothetical protein